MNKQDLRSFVLKHVITRELFFFVGQRKVNLKKIDKRLKFGKLSISDVVLEDCIISLTSYGSRIAELRYTLFSLINQSVRPSQIIVNIALNDKHLVTDDLLSLETYGVIFKYCEDIRSFKKLIPVMEEYRDKCIITVDDDMYYDADFLKSLWEKHIQKPNMIVAHNIYEITFTDNKLNTYSLWPHSIITKKISYKNFFVGCGGVLYPPNSLYKDYNCKQLFQQLTPIADDIWFYFMAYMNGTKITQPDKPKIRFHYINPYREYGVTEGKTLTQENVGLCKNDEQFMNVLNYYNISVEDFIKNLQIEYD